MVSFIHWIKHRIKKSALVGREVATDDGKLVFSIAAMFPSIDFKNKAFPKGVKYQVILGDAGVPVLMEKKAGRANVPHSTLRLKQMVETALARRALKASDLNEGHLVEGETP